MDDCDSSSALEAREREAILKRHQDAAAREPAQRIENGTIVCRDDDCADPLPPERAKAGRAFCVDCQARRERR